MQSLTASESQATQETTQWLSTPGDCIFVAEATIFRSGLLGRQPNQFSFMGLEVSNEAAITGATQTQTDRLRRSSLNAVR